MKIGVVGLGNIAQKAYLPVYSECREQAEFILSTRNEAVRKMVAEKYGFTKTTASVEELIAEKIDACFVHAATSVHGKLVKQLLNAGIHVFVDKPLSENLAEVKEIQQLAKEKQLLLMVGFNRRFAPLVEELKAIPDKQMILLQKNRVSAQQATDFVIYDLFLHVLDTAVYLIDEPIGHVQTRIIEENGMLKRAILHLETEKTTVICTMDLLSGANTETFEVTSPTGTYRLENLTNLTVKTAEQTVVKELGDWTPTLEKRGFYQMVTAFIQGVNDPANANLKQAAIYSSHELCGEMLYQRQRHVL